jgi:hypothetical protein
VHPRQNTFHMFAFWCFEYCSVDTLLRHAGFLMELLEPAIRFQRKFHMLNQLKPVVRRIFTDPQIRDRYESMFLNLLPLVNAEAIVRWLPLVANAIRETNCPEQIRPYWDSLVRVGQPVLILEGLHSSQQCEYLAAVLQTSARMRLLIHDNGLRLLKSDSIIKGAKEMFLSVVYELSAESDSVRHLENIVEFLPKLTFSCPISEFTILFQLVNKCEIRNRLSYADRFGQLLGDDEVTRFVRLREVSQ